MLLRIDNMNNILIALLNRIISEELNIFVWNIAIESIRYIKDEKDLAFLLLFRVKGVDRNNSRNV